MSVAVVVWKIELLLIISLLIPLLPSFFFLLFSIIATTKHIQDQEK